MEKQRNNANMPPEQEKKFQRIQRMIVSIVVAIVIWVLVVNVVNPEITESIKDVPITFVGESYLRDKGFVIVNKDEIPELSLKVKGTRRNLLNGMRRITVEVDVSSIDKKGKSVIPAKVNASDNISVQKQNFSSIELMVEPRYDKEIPVIVEQVGDAGQESRGKIVSSVPEIEEVTVSGSVSDVESIKNCIVTVDVSELENNGKTVHEYRFIDKEGKPVPETSSVFCATGVVAVNNVIYDRHTLDIEVEANSMLRREFKVEYDIRNMNMAVMDVGVAQGADVPEKITAVIPNSGYESGEQTVNLEIKATDNLYVPNYHLMLKINLVPLKEKKASVTVQLKNIPAGLEAGNTEFTLEKKLRVPEDMTEDITATVDCSDFAEGENEGRIKLGNEHIEFADYDDKITVNLTQKQTN